MAAISLKAKIQGPDVESGHIGLRDLVFFSRQLQKALERTAASIGERKHSQRFIQQVTALEVVGMERGSFVLALELSRDQVALPGMDLGEQALEAFFDGWATLLGNTTDLPHAYDIGVLVALRDLGQLFKRGIESMSFELQTRNTKHTYLYDQRVQTRVIERIVGPEQNKVVLEGRLLMADFKETSLKCRLHPSAGPAIMCQFDDKLTDEVDQALRHYVRVTGVAENDPITNEIRLLRIRDVETLDLPQVSDPTLIAAIPGEIEFWHGASIQELAEVQGVGPVESVDSLRGNFWPEDESTDEFVGTIRQWRREDVNT